MKIINHTAVTKNESKPDNLGNKDDNSNPETVLIVNGVLNAPLMLISIIGNALVLAAILRTPSLRSPSTVFLCSLALSDITVGLVIQPVYIANVLINSVGSSLYQAEDFLSILACSVSLSTMTAVSLDRLFALHYHLRYPALMTTKRAIYTSVALWVCCFLVLSLLFWNRATYSLAIFTAVGIAICLFISAVSYIRIYQIVRRHQIQIHVQQRAVQSVNIEHNLNLIRRTNNTMNTFIYYICMILCYLPVFISNLIFFVFNNNWNIYWSFSETLAFMNSSINPFLYCWRSREIRTAVLRIIRKISCKT